jgi:UDP-N-acetylmuramate dehydrogenase
MNFDPVVRYALDRIPDLSLQERVPLAGLTRFGIGGPASLLVDSGNAEAFAGALRVVRQSAVPHVVIGGGTNLVVSDAGFEGVVLRFRGARMEFSDHSLTVEAGAVLQDVVDASVSRGLKGLETMTGIPGYLGAAVYGNAGAYGHSIQERVERVDFTDGAVLRSLNNRECEFDYRESLFKRHKDWVILSVLLNFGEDDPEMLKKTADEIRAIRDAKYPPTMKCAGSIFKNCFLAHLPPSVQAQIPPKLVREGKVPSAWFLEEVGAKGIRRGDIQVATYHANLIYNDGAGTAEDLVAVIRQLKDMVQQRFGFSLEEEVQYIGFEEAAVLAGAQ